MSMSALIIEDRYLGQSHELRGRAAAIARWLAANAERLNSLPQVKLTFNCAGFKSVKPKIEIIEREVRIV